MTTRPPSLAGRPTTADAAGAVAVLAAFALVGLLAGAWPVLLLVLGAMSALVLTILLADAWPGLPLVAGAAVLVFVPVYWVPFALHVQPAPGLLLLSVAVAVGVNSHLASRSPGRLTAVDTLVAVLFSLLAASVLIGVRQSNELVDVVMRWLIPYVAGRLLVGHDLGYEAFVKTIVAVCLALVPFVAVESLTGVNVFTSVVLNDPVGDLWATKLYRFGYLRAEASLGHPIALGMLMGLGAVMALSLYLRAERRSNAAVLWLVASAALVTATVATLSRTGVVLLVSAAAIGLPGAVMDKGFAVRRRRVQGLATVAAGGLLVALAVPQARGLVTYLFGGQGTGEVGTSSRARSALFGAAENSYFSWFGHGRSIFVDAGVSSTDNTYLWFVDRWGMLAALVFLSVLLFLTYRAVRVRPIDARSTILVAAAAALVAMFFVAPITQYQSVLFLLLGAASSALRARPTGVREE